MDVINQRYQEWLDRSTDSEVNAQLLAIKDNESAKKEAFYKDLSFGTAGMRGELGAGTNCLNIYTVRKATQGVAQCMKAHGYTRASVSCDSRINSDLFARVYRRMPEALLVSICRQFTAISHSLSSRAS